MNRHGLEGPACEAWVGVWRMARSELISWSDKLRTDAQGYMASGLSKVPLCYLSPT